MRQIKNPSVTSASFIKNILAKVARLLKKETKVILSSVLTDSKIFKFEPLIVEKTLLEAILMTIFWLKIRISYYTNNWIYTTNHKRIAVNYFWFVILSGIVGMVLATVIRLEFAYPGVGIFAGDSLQYLSLVTAHGVIMVFFMIMPLLLGAFANFLLPTQLGVHDVAFPRLNSAAFWFLPGGLLMLAQLVCVDRRYQRMNCFNIREIESILKKRFFVDLINTHDHKKLLHKTIVDLKFKLNDNFLSPNLFIFYNYGLDFTSKRRFGSLINVNEKGVKLLNENSFFYKTLKNYTHSFIYLSINQFFLNHICTLTAVTSFGFLFKKINLLLTTFVFNSFSLFDSLLRGSTVQNLNFISKDSKNSVNYLKAGMLSFFDFFISSIKNFCLYVFYYFYFSVITFGQCFFEAVHLFFLNFTNFIFFTFKSLSTLSFNFFEFFYMFNLLESFYALNRIVIKTKQIVNFSIWNSPFSSIYFFYILNVQFFFEQFKTSNNLLSNYSFSYYPNAFTHKWANVYFLDNYNFVKISQNFTFTKNFTNFYSYYNFNSHITYIYVLFGLVAQLPFLFFNFFLNIFDFKKMSLMVYNLENILIIWYLPLLLNDNVFYTFLQKILKFDSSRVADVSYALHSFLTFWDKNALPHSQLVSQHLLLFVKNWSVYFLFFFYNQISGLCKNLIDTIVLILFNLRTYNYFNSISYYLLNSSSTDKIGNNLIANFTYNSSLFANETLNEKSSYANEELSSDYRYLRFNNPIFKYDYKSGDYYPKLYKDVYPFLFTSVNDLTGGLRQSPWFLSSSYFEAIMDYFNMHTIDVSANISANPKPLSKINSLDAFTNFFYVLSADNSFLNKRWLAVNVVDQKLYKFYQTSSLQQRIYGNWRQLKFTREAWRCKLLMSRHQKTLFKRYVNEDGVFWSIERNAKDLLPGWAMITPFSSRTRFTAIGKTDIGLMGVLLVLNSSIISAANFIVTYRYLSTLNNRKMRDARSFFTEAIMVSSWMMIAANPMLVIGIIMLLSDRHWQTSFFDYSGGGDTVLFQHMFWFFGHPEVYIIILPTFGFVNTMLSYYLKKRISARASLLYSLYTIAFLGFFVWGHHMYMVGLAHTTRMLFSTLTVMISVPAATKLMHWCVTTVNSAFSMELPLVCVLTFIFLFVSGGISGMCVAHTGMDVLFHDTFYVIGHFHVMFAGAAMIGSFGAFYFYFVAIFGVKYSRIYAYLHFTYYLLGQLFTVIPMFWLGYAGMPRRVLDYPASFGGWHSVISGGHMLSVAGLIAFFIMIFDSLRQAKAVTRNTFGIGRYNTRLNFYIYEIAKLNNVQEKAWALFKFLHKYSLRLNHLNYYNLEHYETVLLSYSFSKK
jgi:heme/copper-type cytochrome/quinol oxidase subunit 1